jgi:hypothetical protein
MVLCKREVLKTYNDGMLLFPNDYSPPHIHNN